MGNILFRVLGPVVLISLLFSSSSCIEWEAEAEAPYQDRPAGAAMTFYVSPMGENTDGISRGTAFSTLAEALKSAHGGDTIEILPGIYHESLDIYQLGADQDPITLRGRGDGVIFDGQRTMTFGFWCTDCQSLVIENLVFRNYTDFGIGINESTQITLRGLEVYDNGFEVQLKKWELEGYGILVDMASEVTVVDCDTYRNGPRTTGKRSMLGTGINIYGCTDCEVSSNRSYDNIGGGLLVEDSQRVLVENNELYANDLDATDDEWWDGAIWVDGGSDITVRNNTIRDNLGPGIQISDEDDQDPKGYVFEKNIVTGNTFGLFIWGFETAEYPTQDVLFLEDNEISGSILQDVILSPDFCLPGTTC